MQRRHGGAPPIKINSDNHPHKKLTTAIYATIKDTNTPIDSKLFDNYKKWLNQKQKTTVRDKLITAIDDYTQISSKQISSKQQTVERVTIGTNPKTTMIPLFKKNKITYCMESSSDKVIIWYKTNGKDGQKYEATNDAEFLEANRRMDPNP